MSSGELPRVEIEYKGAKAPFCFSYVRSALPAGFTLIELIAVILLLSILAIVAVPRFFSKTTFDERFFFDDALSSIRYARKLAVVKGCYIQFSISSAQFVLNYDTQCGVGSPDLTGVLYRPGSDEVFSNSDAPAGTSTWSVVFNSEGSAGRISSGTFTQLASTESVTVGSWSFQIDGPSGFAR
ncbi:MAG: prepilin-type N-terminal cleavage/methylation domain-containing protein [Pseudomonadales bacterium]|nr:prepilin-type N-terminal cleavage/methylation domain-containing protein [Pseudomonadales bacterium]